LTGRKITTLNSSDTPPRDRSILANLKRLLILGTTVVTKVTTVHYFAGLLSDYSRRKQIKNNTRLDNYVDLLKNWEATRAMLELTYGHLTNKDIHKPKNRKILRSCLTFIEAVCTHGLQRIAKETSAALRVKALRPVEMKFANFANRGKTPRALFLASCYSRALIIRPADKATLQKEVDACITRITTPTPLPSTEVLERLRAYIVLLLGKKDVPEDTLVPLPNGKSCFERSAANGGATIALETYGWIPASVQIAEDMDAVFEAAWEFDMDAGNVTWGDTPEEHVFHYGTMNSEIDAAMIAVTDAYVSPPTDRRRTLPETFVEAMFEARFNRKAKLLPINQPDGKIRVATIHHSSVSWAARAMSSYLMPITRQLSITREMLRNQPVQLTNTTHEDKFIYSADLSKSTDPISIDLANFVLTAILTHLGNKPTWWDDAQRAVIAEQELWYNEEKVGTSVCGALMGLGPGWTVLCLLNGFAAHEAGARRGDHAICGDDLTGFWTAKVIAGYERNLEVLGLVANKSKSFVSRTHGVFCERLMTKMNAHEVRGCPEVRIGEACGARALNGDKGRMVLDSLNKLTGHPVIRNLARRVARRLKICNVPGSLASGGGGIVGRTRAADVIRYIKFGPTQLLTHESAPGYTDFRRELRNLPIVKEGPTAREMLVQSMAYHELEHRLTEKRPSPKPRQKSSSEIREQVVQNEKAISRLLTKCHGPLNALRALGTNTYARMTPRLVRHISHHIRRKAYQKALSLAQKSWDVKIAGSTARTLFLSAHSEYKPRFTRNLTPAPEVWDSSSD